MKRITMAEIKAHEWFQKDYVPAVPFDNDDEDSQLDLVLPVKEVIGDCLWPQYRRQLHMSAPH